MPGKKASKKSKERERSPEKVVPTFRIPPRVQGAPAVPAVAPASDAPVAGPSSQPRGLLAMLDKILADSDTSDESDNGSKGVNEEEDPDQLSEGDDLDHAHAAEEPVVAGAAAGAQPEESKESSEEEAAIIPQKRQASKEPAQSGIHC